MRKVVGPHNYYSHANRIFVDALASDDSLELTILDVGCGAGALGQAVAGLRPVILDGIEREPVPAKCARENGYRTVFELDLQSSDLQCVTGRYDVIALGDVLEHLLDPKPVLARLLAKLAPGGQVLVSLPNIGFITCRLNHLFGRWEYRDYGIMDRTHLHFYTVATMRRFLVDCELVIKSQQGYVGLNDYHPIIRNIARWLGEVWPTLFAIQVVFSARPFATK